MPHEVLTTFVYSCVGVVVVVAGFFASSWFNSQRKTTEALTVSVEKLTSLINEIHGKMLLNEQSLGYLRERVCTAEDEIKTLHGETRCPRPDCPMRRVALEVHGV